MVVKSHDSNNRLPIRKGIERSDGGVRSEVGREGKGERVGMVIRWYQRIKKVDCRLLDGENWVRKPRAPDLSTREA